MDAPLLTCTVSHGQFSGEYAVSIEVFDGTRVSLFAGESDVELDSPLTGDDSVAGRIQVEILQQSGDLLLVRLPQPTLESGQTITVKSEAIQQEA